MQLLAEDADDIDGEVVAGLVWGAAEAVEPHGAGQQVGAGEGDLDGRLVAGADEGELVGGEGSGTAQGAVDDGVAHLASGHVEGAQLAVELVGVVDHGGQVAEGDELAVVEEATDEAGVVVAALLAIGDDIDAGAALGVEGEAHGVVRGLAEGVVAEAAFEVVVQGLEHPAGSGPAPDAHDRERGDGGDVTSGWWLVDSD